MKLPKDITPEQINHIKELSNFVREKENEARKNYFKLLEIQSKLLEKRVFDTKIDISEKLMICFETEENEETNRDFFCVKEQWISTVFRTREDKEEPSKIEILDLENLYSKDEVFHKSYNFFLDRTHPFHGIHFCRGMYNIINKHELSFENLLKIDNVWIDFEAHYDFNSYESLLDK